MTEIDLHSTCVLCGLMDESGRRVPPKELPCNLAEILQVLEPCKAQIAQVAQVAVDLTCNWHGLIDGLENHG